MLAPAAVRRALGSVARCRALGCGACGAAPGDLLFAPALIARWSTRPRRVPFSPGTLGPTVLEAARSLACGARRRRAWRSALRASAHRVVAQMAVVAFTANRLFRPLWTDARRALR